MERRVETPAGSVGQVGPFNDAKRRMGSPHTLRKASHAAEINRYQKQQSKRKMF
ncbi:hypothetical protein P8610_18880 [Fictibacillus sp. UD]